MHILITGSTGFIGKHLLRRLLEVGHHCRCLMRNPIANDPVYKHANVEIVKGDVTKPDTLDLHSKNIDFAYHLAAAGHVAATSEKDHKAFRELNVQGTINLVRSCAHNKVKRIIHFSSTAAMGLIKSNLIDEETPCRPQTPYQKSKYEGEMAALETGARLGIDVIVLRPCMVYGPGGKGEFFKWCRLIKKGVFPRVGIGKNLTPIVHVRDVVQAAVNSLQYGSPGKVYLIASRSSEPLKKIFQAVSSGLEIKRVYIYLPFWLVYFTAYILEKWALFRKAPPIVSRKNILSIVSGRDFKISRAVKDLGYSPQEELFAGVKETINWYRLMKLI